MGTQPQPLPQEGSAACTLCISEADLPRRAGQDDQRAEQSQGEALVSAIRLRPGGSRQDEVPHCREGEGRRRAGPESLPQGDPLLDGPEWRGRIRAGLS